MNDDGTRAKHETCASKLGESLELLLFAQREDLADWLHALVAPLGLACRDGNLSTVSLGREPATSGLLALCAARGAVDGTEALRQLATHEQVRGICVLTEDSSEETGSALLYSGADLWLPLSMAPSLLRAFLLAAARRLRADSRAVAIDPRSGTVTIAGWTAKLTQTEFRVFEYLFTHNQRWVPECELRERALSKGYHSSDSLVRVHIHSIRRMLGPHQQCLRSTRQLGYRLNFDMLQGEVEATRDVALRPATLPPPPMAQATGHRS